MLKRLYPCLLDPVAVAGGGAAAPAAKPAAAAPAPAAAAPAADLAPASDDPFAPPPKPAGAAAPKPGAAAPAAAVPAADEFETVFKDIPKEVRARVPKEFRTRLNTAIADAKLAQQAKTDLEAKIKQFEGQGKDTSALTNQLKAIEKERDDARAELRAARQEASPEFKDKYEKPFNQAAERAKKQVTELTVVVNAETGETRPAVWTDFTALYSLPTGKAIEEANKLFGTAAPFVLGLREKLFDLDTAKATALEEEKAQFKQRNDAETANRLKEGETVSTLWKSTNSRLAESVEDYKNDPTDTELNDARKHALTVFDTPVQAADRQDFINKKVLRDAHIRQKVGAYPVLKLQLARKDEKIAALQKQVDELKGTAAGGVQRPGGEDAGGAEEDWGTGLKKAVQPAA